MNHYRDVNYGAYPRVGSHLSGAETICNPARMAKRVPLFKCQECGRKFYTVASAKRASFGDSGCPGCGGSDIDVA